MRAPFPTRTKVGPLVYKVLHISNLVLAQGEAHGDDEHIEHLGVTGICDADAETIAIEADIADNKKAEVYLHEHLHAIMSLAGLRDTLTFEEEEQVVRRMAPLTLHFLRQNPRVYTYLTGRETYRP